MDGSTANLLRRFLQRAPDALTDEELLTLLLHLLIGGGLMGNVLNYMIQLLSNVGSLL